MSWRAWLDFLFAIPMPGKRFEWQWAIPAWLTMLSWIVVVVVILIKY